MTSAHVRFLSLAGKTIAAHTVTYLVMGVLASSLLDYGAAFSRPDMTSWMRQLSHPVVMAGPLFQPLRGPVFTLAIYAVRDVSSRRCSCSRSASCTGSIIPRSARLPG
jgi:hypothetical protein